MQEPRTCFFVIENPSPPISRPETSNVNTATAQNERKDTSRQDRDRKTTQKPHTKAPHPVSNFTEMLSEFGNLEPLQSSQSVARTIVLYCTHPWQALNLRISSFYHFSLVQLFSCALVAEIVISASARWMCSRLDWTWSFTLDRPLCTMLVYIRCLAAQKYCFLLHVWRGSDILCAVSVQRIASSRHISQASFRNIQTGPCQTTTCTRLPPLHAL